MAMDVYDAAGRPLRGEVGELVCTQPWPGMTRGIWGDPERYLETYWRRFPGVWTHGDWATIDADGDWFLHGRSDDTLNVAGKRIGPAEYESALVGDPAVAEACAVGVPHDVKGEVVWCFCVLRTGSEPGEELRARLRAALRRGARQGLRARRGALHDGAAEDAQREDPAPRRARGGGRRGSRRPLDARGSRRDRRRARERAEAYSSRDQVDGESEAGNDSSEASSTGSGSGG